MNDTDQGTGPRPAADPVPPPGSAPPPRPPLRRRRDDRVVAGVASGLAAYLDIDPALARIGFVVLLFTGGIGVPLYIAGWLLIPEADEHEAAAHQLVRSKGPGFWIGIAILVVVALAVADQLTIGGGNLWPLVFIAAGVALWRAAQDDAPRRHPPTTPGPHPSPTSTEETRPMATTHDPAVRTPDPTASTAEVPPPPVTPRPPVDFTPPPVPQRTNAMLGRITFALALIAAGVTVLLDRAGLVQAELAHVLAASLTVLGLGLIVGAWFGRARSMIFPGLLLAPLVIAASLFHAADVPVGSGFGERIHHIESAAAVESGGYELAAGQLTLRFDDLQDAGEPVAVRAELGAGQLYVTVPPDAEVRVTGTLGIGELVLFDRAVNGAGIDETVVREGEPGAPVLVLDLRVGVGQILVEDGSGPFDVTPQDQQEFSR